jgi:hypothetical protein
MDDRTFHDLVDALERGEQLPDNLDADTLAALTMARQLFAERQELPATMAERRWRTEPTSPQVAVPVSPPPVRPGRRLFGMRWLPELAMLSLITVLGLALVLGARRGAMPAQGSETPVGTVTGTPGVALSGRLLIVKSQADGGPGLVAVDMRTGKETFLWSVPLGPDADLAYRFSASPDGALVAYLIERDGTEDPPHRLAVRGTTPGAEPTNFQLTDRSRNNDVACYVNQFIWSPSGKHFYFDKSCRETGTGALHAFELHRLVVQRAADGSVTLGPDEMLWRVEPNQVNLADGAVPNWMELAAVHEPSGRAAALLSGPTASGYVKAVQILELATGRELAREVTGDSNLSWAATQDGSRLAFVDCTACDSDGQARVRRLDIATAGDPAAVVDLAVVGPEQRPGDPVWSPTNHWLAFADVHSAQLVGDPPNPAATVDPIQQLGATENHAPAVFSPQGDLLLTFQLQLYDPVSQQMLPLPWTPPPYSLFGRRQDVLDYVYDKGFVVGWVPDYPAPAAAPATPTPASWLTGRMLFVLRGDGGALPETALSVMDVRTGKSETVWSVPSPESLRSEPAGPETEFAVGYTASPDGELVAYVLGRDGEDSPRRLAVRRTVPGAEPATVDLLDGAPSIDDPVWVTRMIFTPAGDRLYYAKWFAHAPGGEQASEAVLNAFELHRLAVQQGHDGTVILGTDEMLWRLDGDRLLAGQGAMSDGSIDLAAIHEPSGRALLLAGPNENGIVLAIQLVDLATGKELSRVPTDGENFQWAATQDGSRLAFVDCSDCDAGGPSVVRHLDLAEESAPELPTAPAWSQAQWLENLVWSADGRWLAGSLVSGNVAIIDTARVAGAPGQITYPDSLKGAIPLAFSPDSKYLLNTNGAVFNIADGTTEVMAGLVQNGMVDREGYLGWVPAAPASASTSAREPTDRATPAASATPPSPPPTEPANLATPLALPTPIATGTFLISDAWSPDGRWLAYWQTLDRMKDGELHLRDLATGQHCEQAAVTTYMYEHVNVVDWLPDGTLHVMGNRGKQHFRGQPCAGPLVELGVTGGPTPTAEPSYGSGSPDGKYRADTQHRSPELTSNIEHWQTRLIRNSDDAVVATADWDAESKMLPDLGGEWLPDVRFLINEGEQRGPLLLDTSGAVSEVATTWFKLGREHKRSDLYAGVLPGTGAEDWHVLLSSAEQTDIVWLYHPETDVAEQLTVSNRWASLNIPAPRGWLVDRGGAEHVSVRPLDPVGGTFTPLAAAAGLSGQGTDGLEVRWSPNGRRAVLTGTLPSGVGEVRLISFPEGIVQARWPLVAPFTLLQFVHWSPDNRHVAVYVTAADQKSEALYVLDADVGEAGH